MAINSTEIKRIADLSGLEMPDNEYYIIQLNKLFDIIDQIQEIDTNGIIPFSHPIEQIQGIRHHLRDDVITEVINRDDNQRSAPAVYNGLYLVPKVIE